MEVVARRGFGATVEEIAEVSGVSPRTIFRHYASHDRLIVATVRDMFTAWGRQPIDGQLPRPTDDLDGWLKGLAIAVHTTNAAMLGDAFWDIYAPTAQTSEVLSEVATLRRETRIRAVRYLVLCAWQAAGGTGDPPEDLMLAFALNLSNFTTRALTDFDRTPEQVGLLTADILKKLLRLALRDADQHTPG